MTDPISDMLTRIRNAAQARLVRVEIPASRLKLEIARILEREGYIADCGLVSPMPDGQAHAAATEVQHPVIRITLKYGPRGERAISGLERVSKPGRRVYCGRQEVPRVLGGLGMAILTTSRGLMTGQEASRAGVGGEVLCNVW